MILATLNMIALMGFFAETAFAGSECVQVVIQGTECVNLAVQADLKACGDDLVRMGRVRCANGQANVLAYGKKSKYRIDLKQKSQGAWGSSEWVRNDVTTVTTKRSPASASEERVPEDALTKSPLIAPPVPVAERPSKGIELGAYFDGYIGYNFNNPRSSPTASGRLPDAQNNMRSYDIYSKQFRLALAEISVKAFRKETRLLIDFDFGDAAEINGQSGLNEAGVTPVSSGGPSPVSADSISKHIGQAVLSFVPSDRWVIEAGKMPTHVGYELMKAKENWNYSRSFLYTDGIPIWHTGLHAAYEWIPDHLSTGLYLYQGWNTLYKTTDSFSYGAQVKWTPGDLFSGTYNYVGGPNTIGDNRDWKQLHELILSWLSNQKLSFAMDFIYGNQKNVLGVSPDLKSAEWGAANLALKWQMSPDAYFSPRFEWYRDVNGWTLGGNGQSLYSVTLTGSKHWTDGIETRIEYRYDFSSEADRFITGDGTSAHQQTLVLGMLFSY